ASRLGLGRCPTKVVLSVRAWARDGLGRAASDREARGSGSSLLAVEANEDRAALRAPGAIEGRGGGWPPARRPERLSGYVYVTASLTLRPGRSAPHHRVEPARRGLAHSDGLATLSEGQGPRYCTQWRRLSSITRGWSRLASASGTSC